MTPALKAPGYKHLKLKYDQLLSNFAFNFNLRRYNTGAAGGSAAAAAANQHLILSNRSAAWLAHGDVARATDDAHGAVAAGPADWPKGHYRLATALERRGAWGAAAAAYATAIDRTPGDDPDPAMAAQLQHAKREAARQDARPDKGRLPNGGGDGSGGGGGGGTNASFFTQWALTPIGRLDRLLGRPGQKPEQVFKPGSMLSDYYAAHCDWHDGMCIALKYRSFGALMMENKNNSGASRDGMAMQVGVVQVDPSRTPC